MNRKSSVGISDARSALVRGNRCIIGSAAGSPLPTSPLHPSPLHPREATKERGTGHVDSQELELEKPFFFFLEGLLQQ